MLQKKYFYSSGASLSTIVGDHLCTKVEFETTNFVLSTSQEVPICR